MILIRFFHVNLCDELPEDTIIVNSIFDTTYNVAYNI